MQAPAPAQQRVSGLVLELPAELLPEALQLLLSSQIL